MTCYDVCSIYIYRWLFIFLLMINLSYKFDVLFKFPYNLFRINFQEMLTIVRPPLIPHIISLTKNSPKTIELKYNLNETKMHNHILLQYRTIRGPPRWGKHRPLTKKKTKKNNRYLFFLNRLQLRANVVYEYHQVFELEIIL